MTKRNYGRKAPIGSTDVYSRKHIDKQFDRLERLRSYDKERIRALEADLKLVYEFLALGPHSHAFVAFKASKA